MCSVSTYCALPLQKNLQIHTYIYIYIYIYTHTHTHIHMHIYTHIYTHRYKNGVLGKHILRPPPAEKPSFDIDDVKEKKTIEQDDPFS